MNSEEKEKHIVNTLNALGEYWLARPELRLGQIMSNAFHCARLNGGADDLFYLADKDIVKGIETLAKEN